MARLTTVKFMLQALLQQDSSTKSVNSFAVEISVSV
jgi:hypothetical protein